MQSLVAFCFRRPVAVSAFYALVVVAAAVAYVRLPVALLPDVRYPTLVVWTGYPDVPPERVERAVTERIEEAVAGTAGLMKITGRSLLGGSLVQLDFGWNTQLDLALLSVREQIDKLGESLPREADRPTVLRMDPNDRPIMILALSEGEGAEREDLVALKRLGEEVIARRLEQIRDVARVVVTGGFDRRIDVMLDPARLAAYGLSISRIESALRTANVAQPGGSIRRGPFRFAVEVSGEFQTLEQIAGTIVAHRAGAPVRLGDLAEVRESVEERRGLVRLDGRETLMLLVERRPDANTVRAAAEVRRVLAELQTELTRARVDVVVDESRFIDAAISGVTQAVMLGGILAILVLFLFLRRREALVAVAIAVPLSLALTLVLFDMLDVTFNLISLSGLALGVGMLMDNAIVVVENIARLREEGMESREAGLRGTIEVAGAMTSSTLTTMAVFLPITFVEGLAGRLFLDQSLAVVGSLGASLLVALTVVPLVATPRRAGAPTPASHGPGRVILAYERALVWALDHRAAVVLATGVLVVAATAILVTLPREVIPRTDQGRVDVRITLPSDADLPLVSMRAAEIEEALLARPGVEHVLGDLGERDEARLQLDPRPTYEGSLTVILADGTPVSSIRAEDLATPGDMKAEVHPVRTQLELMLADDQADLNVDLVSDRREVGLRVLGEVRDRLAARPELANVRVADELDVPAYRIRFRRDEMARHGVSSFDVAGQLRAGSRGVQATELRSINEDVPIVLRSSEVSSIEELLAQRIATGDGPLPLSLFIDAEFVLLPAALIRSEQAPVLRVLADVAPGSDLSAATRAVTEATSGVASGSVRVRVSGANDSFRQSLRAMLLSLLFSVVLVYLILAAQFESFAQPLLIMITVPLAAVGVAPVLLLTGQTINLMMLTGCVVLVGIVDNDAILKIDFVNQKRAAGLPVREALLAAGRDRFRPIVMNTVTVVLGLLPLTFGMGSAGELREPLAIVMAGGLTAATVLTLIVVPVFYTFIAGRE